ncbi:MAG: late competence development ComFB family protein [Gemmatimonadota bacterium]
MIKNLVEEHVLQAYDALVGHFPAFCGCDVCRSDVLAYALNRLPPRYVSTLEGLVVSEVSLERQQAQADISVVVMEAVRMVMRSPRCGKVAPA